MEIEWVQLAAVDGYALPNSTTCLENKLGGHPDWPSSVDPHFNSKCELCNFLRPLVFQCYAPLENSPYHRTLYIYACINPLCWNKSESWTCIRIQHRDVEKVMEDIEVKANFSSSSNLWCSDANDWDDENVMSENIASEFSKNSNIQTNPDSIDETMDEISNNFGNMSCANVNSRLLELQKNMNNFEDVSAEIETEGCSNITVDLPVCINSDIPKILNQKPNLPNIIDKSNIEFKSMYIKVYPEDLNDDVCDHHVNDLLTKYNQSEKDLNLDLNSEKKSQKNKSFNDEEYEKGKPLHGDLLFHSFVTRIKRNPEQIVRYSLGGRPLLITESIFFSNAKCIRCFSDKQFELQILPTSIPFLRITGSKETHLEFGNVLIFTCKSSCWDNSENYVIETVFVQTEPN